MGRNDQAPLLGPPAAPPSAIYTDSARRPPRDVAWGWLYAVSLALALAGGVFAAVHRCAGALLLRAQQCSQSGVMLGLGSTAWSGMQHTACGVAGAAGRIGQPGAASSSFFACA
jgi:hypothetical protein